MTLPDTNTSGEQIAEWIHNGPDNCRPAQAIAAKIDVAIADAIIQAFIDYPMQKDKESPLSGSLIEKLAEWHCNRQTQRVIDAGGASTYWKDLMPETKKSFYTWAGQVLAIVRRHYEGRPATEQPLSSKTSQNDNQTAALVLESWKSEANEQPVELLVDELVDDLAHDADFHACARYAPHEAAKRAVEFLTPYLRQRERESGTDSKLLGQIAKIIKTDPGWDTTVVRIEKLLMEAGFDEQGRRGPVKSDDSKGGQS